MDQLQISTVSQTNRNKLAEIMEGVHNNIIRDLEVNRLSISEHRGTLILANYGQGLDASRNSESRRIKSEYSEEEKERIRVLKQEMIMFQNKLKHRAEQFVQLQLKQSEKEREEEQSFRSRLRNKHRKEVLQRKLKKQQQKQKVELEKQQTKKEKRSNSQRRIYQEREEEHRKRQQQEESQKLNILKIMAAEKANLIDIKKIGQHQKSYVKYLKINKQERMKRLQQIKQASDDIMKKEEKKKLKSKFYQELTIRLSEEKKKAEQVESLKYLHQQRVKQYVQHLKSQSKFLNKKHPLSVQVKVQEPGRREHLSQQKLREKGNQYMRDSLMKIAKTDSSLKVRPMTVNQIEVKKSENTKNYLRQLRQERLKSEGSAPKISLLTLSETKINKILVASLTQEQKIQRLKRMAHRLQAHPFSHKINQQIQKVQAKMRILQATLHSQR